MNSERFDQDADVLTSVERLCLAECQKRLYSSIETSQDVEQDRQVLAHWREQLPVALNTESIHTDNCNYHEETEG